MTTRTATQAQQPLGSDEPVSHAATILCTKDLYVPIASGR